MTRSQSVQELRREATGLAALYAESALRSSDEGAAAPEFAAEKLELATGDELYYVGASLFPGQRAIDLGDKSDRVARFHRNTMRALGEIAGAAGLNDPSNFMPYHFMFRQKDNEFLDGNEAYPYLPEGFLVYRIKN